MYNVEILVRKFASEYSFKETVKYYSLWAARCMAREYASCNDVEKVEIIDCETGELMLTLDYDGKVVYDSEG